METNLINGFRYRPGFDDYICPEQKVPERVIIERKDGVTERRFYYQLEDCKNCARRTTCCPNRQKMVLKIRTENHNTAGANTIGELFQKFPMGRSCQSMIDFRYSGEGVLIAAVKGAEFEIGASGTECTRLWDYITRMRICFTDGSYKDGHISSSYVSFDCFNRAEQRTVSARTNESALDAEFLAAIMAVEDAIRANVSYLEIRADNKTVVDLGTGELNPKCKHPYAFEFREKLQLAKEHGVKVAIAKVAGHSGDVGNELADYSAGSLRRLHPVYIHQVWNSVEAKEALSLTSDDAQEDDSCRREVEILLHDSDENVLLTDSEELIVPTSKSDINTGQQNSNETLQSETIALTPPTDLMEPPKPLFFAEQKPEPETQPAAKTTTKKKKKKKAPQPSQNDTWIDPFNAPVIGRLKSMRYTVKGCATWNQIRETYLKNHGNEAAARRAMANRYVGFKSEEEAMKNGFKKYALDKQKHK